MRRKIRSVIGGVVISLFTVSCMFVLLSITGVIINASTGCAGIDNFYTGVGFYEDWNTLIQRVSNSGRTNMSNGSIISFDPIPPGELLNGKKYDCKSISNAIYCLAQKYNRTCKFEHSIRLFSDLSFGSGHMGVWCWDDEYGKWSVMY